jgi:hypothetical protein
MAYAHFHSSMPPDLANQFNPLACQAGRISYRGTQGTEHLVEWDGQTARVGNRPHLNETSPSSQLCFH